MKSLKIGIACAIVLVAIVAIYNKVQLDKYVKKYRHQVEGNAHMRHAIEQIEDAVVKSQTASMRHLGKNLVMSNLELMLPADQHDLGKAKVPRLLLVFSELSCNVCQDKETEFAVEIASTFGKKHVSAIIHATNRRYVRNYIRLNQVNFPVYYLKDKNNRFFKDNDIH